MLITRNLKLFTCSTDVDMSVCLCLVFVLNSAPWFCWRGAVACSRCTTQQDCWFPPAVNARCYLESSRWCCRSQTYAFSPCQELLFWLYSVNRRGLSTQSHSNKVEEVWTPVWTLLTLQFHGSDCAGSWAWTNKQHSDVGVVIIIIIVQHEDYFVFEDWVEMGTLCGSSGPSVGCCLWCSGEPF